MEKRYKIIISGGGTGGHIFPAISIANKLKELTADIEILFVGAEGKMEMERVPAAGYKIIGLPIAGLKRSLTLSNLALPFKILKSIRKAGRLIETFKPDAVVGVGGYASAPLLWSARIRKVPYLIQEQNSYAGITNKFLGSGASRICVAFDGMEKFFPADKIMVTGNPIRERITAATPAEKEVAKRDFGIDPEKKCILVIGGSLGARTLNNCVRSWISGNINSDIQLIWQYGKIYRADCEAFLRDHPSESVKGHAFISNMDTAFAAADLVITRAGAGTISELAAAGKAAIFVPSPNVAEDHQTFNARSLTDKGAALMVSDEDAQERLMTMATELVKDNDRIEELEKAILSCAKPDAAEVIAKEVLKLCEK